MFNVKVGDIKHIWAKVQKRFQAEEERIKALEQTFRSKIVLIMLAFTIHRFIAVLTWIILIAQAL